MVPRGGRARGLASRLARVALAALVAGGAAAAPARAHDSADLEDEFVKGVFSPSFVPPAPGSYDLPPITQVQGFGLVDAAGRKISTRTLTAGKISVVSFIYTACPERLGCPLASAALRDLQDRIKAEALGREVALLSVSFDRGRDTPAQLAKYSRAYGADPGLWRFATAPSDRVLDDLLRSYGQDRAPVYDSRGRFMGRYRHVLKVFLVDRDGYVRNIYSAGFLVADLIVNDIKTVLSGGAGKRAEPASGSGT